MTDPVAAIGELAIDDLYLAKACASGSAPALAAFAELCDPALAGSLRSMGIAPDLVDELVQEVRTKLFVAVDGPPKIATYSGRAALKSWARTIATRSAVDRMRRKDMTTGDDAVLDAMPDATDGPELAYFRVTYHVEFKEAFEEALATLDVRERNVLRHHHVDGLTVEEIGALYGVHKTTAFRWVHAARTSLSKRTRSAFQQRVKVLPGDMESILQLLQSQIDLSLSRVLS
jgi:RNA polymerase sigma-70 factor (ECF subfamily)